MPSLTHWTPVRVRRGLWSVPNLEDLIIECEVVDIKRVTRMAEARALRGARLKLVRIASQDKFGEIDALELKKHASYVER